MTFLLPLPLFLLLSSYAGDSAYAGISDRNNMCLFSPKPWCNILSKRPKQDTGLHFYLDTRGFAHTKLTSQHHRKRFSPGSTSHEFGPILLQWVYQSIHLFVARLSVIQPIHEVEYHKCCREDYLTEFVNFFASPFKLLPSKRARVNHLFPISGRSEPRSSYSRSVPVNHVPFVIRWRRQIRT